MKLLPQLLVLGSLATLGTGLNIVHAQEQTGDAEAITARLLECRAIESALQRLDCYDEVSRNVTSSGGRAGTVATRRVEEARQRAEENRGQAETRRQAALSQAEAARERAQQGQGENPSLRTDEFGREHRRQQDPDEGPHYIEIVEAWQNPHGLWRFRLESGAEWHQLQSGYFDYEEGDRYYIERGMLNSFRLGREGSNRMIRVRRVD